MKIDGGRFLVTGGAGFIGSHMADMLLERGAARVTILDNFVRGRKENIEHALIDPRARLCEGDITSQEDIDEAVGGIDGVFHMASLCLQHCQEHPRAGFETNVTGTCNLLESCANSGVRRFVFSSSSSVYGNAVCSPMDEEHPFENRDFYGATKICGEALCRAFHCKYDLPYVSLRYMNAYGPRQDFLGAYVAVIIRIIDRLQQGLPPILYRDGSQAFDFVYVEDICKANRLAMESEVSNEAYNISSGKQTSVLELCRMIMELMGKEGEIEFQPAEDTTLVTNRIGSTEKAGRDLAFFAAVNLEEGLKQTIRWRLGTT